MKSVLVGIIVYFLCMGLCIGIKRFMPKNAYAGNQHMLWEIRIRF